MTSLTSGVQTRHQGVWHSVATQGPATGTATQTLTISRDVVDLTGPTATITNWYTLADGSEGQELCIRYEATGAGGTTASGGDIHIVPVTSGNLFPESSITFRKPEDYWLGKFIDGQWVTQRKTTWELGLTTASGAIPITVDNYRLVRATGTDMVFSLADGAYEGQRLLVTAVTGTAVRTVTPTTPYGYTSLQMGNVAAAGATGVTLALLQFVAGAWILLSGPVRMNAGTATDARDVFFTT